MNQIFDNHNYDIGPAQICHICSEIEPSLRHPTGDERTDRAAMHMVHKVRAHLHATTREWNGGQAEGRIRAVD